ncbi:hypothetical protein [Mesorhizobium neociceri]|uniref:Uncharacterized protein n=1 Tax=Mesorhizobium neociceri TaxID=1307853 RepID=A0A838B2D0_9HYPH|nr:hypothetical protein [Mesorhizobium neociceri]MBA1140243.1 hypothetical protein [Mesorhizobium neociceri]
MNPEEKVMRSYLAGMLAVGIFLAFTVAPSDAGEDHSSLDSEFNKLAGAYLCMGEAAGGVRYEPATRTWSGAVFNVEEDRFVVELKYEGETKVDNILGGRHLVGEFDVKIKKFGEVSGEPCLPESPVDSDFFKPIRMNFFGKLRCSLVSPHYTIYDLNLESLRYMEIYTGDFTDGKDKEGETPNMTVGKCTKID